MQFSGPGQQNAPSNPVANFFRTNFNLCLTIFDTRRGQCEGEEHEKLLSFFPTTAPVHVRTSIVGLAQAVASFATTLTEVCCFTGAERAFSQVPPYPLHCTVPGVDLDAAAQRGRLPEPNPEMILCGFCVGGHRRGPGTATRHIPAPCSSAGWGHETVGIILGGTILSYKHH